MQFRLKGNVYYSVGSCHDDRCIDINQEFEAPTKKAAIKKATRIAKKIHGENYGRTDYGFLAKLYLGKKPILKVRFQEEVLARPAIPAQSAIPEELIIKSLK